MRKIVMGFMGLVLTASVVAGTAYAAWSDTVNISGVTLASGNADLRISDADDYDQFDSGEQAVNFNGQGFSGMYPGWSVPYTFWLQNHSSSAIGLNVSLRLTNAGGNWNELKDVVMLKIENMDDGGSVQGTLAEWNAGMVNLPGSLENQTDEDEMKATVWMKSDATNTTQSKSLTNVSFQFLAEQI